MIFNGLKWRDINARIIWLCLLCFVLSSCCINGTDTSYDTKVELFPEKDTVLSGYHEISIHYDRRRNLTVKDIIYDLGNGPQSLISEETPLRIDPGRYAVSFCIDCLDADKITIDVRFNDPNQPAITREYVINRLPILTLESKHFEDNTIILDAGNSVDPEGADLAFTWEHIGEAYNGPIYETTVEHISFEPVLISITDGVTTFKDLIFYDIQMGAPIPASIKSECELMSIETKGPSWNNPTINLGPMPPVGTQMPIDNNKKLTKDYRLGFAFDVNTFLKSSQNPLDEGQDIAASWNDGTGVNNKTGRVRKTNNRSQYETGIKNAPFPNPMGRPGQHPQMVEDNYDNHPLQVTINLTGIGSFKIQNVLKKQLYKAAIGYFMSWFDLPGLELHRGHSIANGITYKAYFRTWMTPINANCQKHFIVEIKVDNNGIVTKNELRMR
jgi:hypothetical protein